MVKKTYIFRKRECVCLESVLITPNLCIMSMIRSADSTSREVSVSRSWSGATGGANWAVKTLILQLWSQTVWHTHRRSVQWFPRWANTWKYPQTGSSAEFSTVHTHSQIFTLVLISNLWVKEGNHVFGTLYICTDVSVWFLVGRCVEYHGPSEMYSSSIK